MFYVMQVELDQSFYFQPAHVPVPSVIHDILIYLFCKCLFNSLVVKLPVIHVMLGSVVKKRHHWKIDACVISYFFMLQHKTYFKLWLSCFML